jgi:predicted phosphoribosyltransferase
MNKRRIVVINDDSIARGGTAVLAVMSAKALADRGHEVIWLCGA